MINDAAVLVQDAVFVFWSGQFDRVPIGLLLHSVRGLGSALKVLFDIVVVVVWFSVGTWETGGI